MSVMYPPTIIDTASIMTQVKMMLRYYHSINVFHTQVETSSGLSRLDGKARDTAERDLVIQLVSDVHGSALVA